MHVDSKWASALYGLALVCIKLKQPEEACKHLQDALRQKPSDASIKYLLALAYRNSKDVMNSWQMYKQIFPTSESIHEYKHRVDEHNKSMVESTSITGDDSQIHFSVDFYSHMQEMGLVDPQSNYCIDLWQFYGASEGWQHDRIGDVLNLLSKVRFFNRFSEEHLMLLLRRVTLKKLPKRQALYLQDGECAIVISGKLHMMSY